MKHLSKYLLTLLLGLSFVANAQFQQGDCGTGPAPEHIRSFIQSVDYSSPLPEDYPVINIPVTIHIVRTSNGGGGFFENNAFLTICDLNNRMASAGMFFYLAGPVRFIDDDTYYNAPDYSPLFNMIDIENVPQTMNIYYTNLGQMGLCGFAFYPNSGPGGPQNDGAVVMSFACSQPNGTTLTHEVGHFFALPHTFDQTSSNPLSATNAERVTRLVNEVAPRLGANCATEGDGFCDTPADFIGSRWSCPTGQVQFDINGDRFRPDSSFYMSYSNDLCMSRFSTQQILAMRATLANLNAPRGYLLTTPMPAFSAINQAPAQVSPAINDTLPGNRIVFRWNAMPGATSYQIRVLLFNFAVIDTITTDTFFVSNTRAIRQMREHNWEVRAINGGNLCTPYGPRNTFFASSYVNTTSVSEQQWLQVKVYPNPTQPGANVQWELPENTILSSIALRDMQGRLVHLQKNGLENNRLQIPADLFPGIYLLDLQSTESRSIIRLHIQP